MQKGLNSTHNKPQVGDQPAVEEMATILKWLFFIIAPAFAGVFLCIDVLLLNLCYKARLSLGYHLRNVKINLRAGKDQLITINLGQIERNDSLSKI